MPLSLSLVPRPLTLYSLFTIYAITIYAATIYILLLRHDQLCVHATAFVGDAASKSTSNNIMLYVDELT